MANQADEPEMSSLAGWLTRTGGGVDVPTLVSGVPVDVVEQAPSKTRLEAETKAANRFMSEVFPDQIEKSANTAAGLWRNCAGCCNKKGPAIDSPVLVLL